MVSGDGGAGTGLGAASGATAGAAAKEEVGSVIGATMGSPRPSHVAPRRSAPRLSLAGALRERVRVRVHAAREVDPVALDAHRRELLGDLFRRHGRQPSSAS